MDLRYIRCKVMETLDLWMMSLGEPRLWIRSKEVLGLIQVGTQVTYEVNTRSGVKVLATGEDIHCLGKSDQCREGKDRIGAI